MELHWCCAQKKKKKNQPSNLHHQSQILKWCEYDEWHVAWWHILYDIILGTQIRIEILCSLVENRAFFVCHHHSNMKYPFARCLLNSAHPHSTASFPSSQAHSTNEPGNEAKWSVMLTLKLLLPSMYTLTPRSIDDRFLGFLCVCVCVYTCACVWNKLCYHTSYCHSPLKKLCHQTT